MVGICCIWFLYRGVSVIDKIRDHIFDLMEQSSWKCCGSFVFKGDIGADCKGQYRACDSCGKIQVVNVDGDHQSAWVDLHKFKPERNSFGLASLRRINFNKKDKSLIYH